MLKAGSLLYAIFIALLISSAVGSFVLFSYYQNLRVLHYEGRIKAIENSKSAINYLKAINPEDYFPEPIQLFSDPLSLVKTELTNWGLFHLATAKTSFKNEEFGQAVFLGYKNNEPFALNLADNNQALSISGNSRIIGTAYLPKLGIKRAYIEGRSFTGNNLVEGAIKTSTKSLPKITDYLNSYLTESLNQGIPDFVIDYELFKNSSEYLVNHSFYDSTLILYSSSTINLTNGNLEGKIIIKSDVEINVNNTMLLENVLLIAPKIYFQTNFKGSAHMIAADTIILGAFSQFDYPSSIAMKPNDKNCYLGLGESSIFNGEVIIAGEKDLTNSAIVEVKDNSIVMGNVFCFDKVALSGKVNGSVSCNSFYLKTSSSVYENYILNGKINAGLLNKEYVGIQLPQSKSTKSIAKWLY